MQINSNENYPACSALPVRAKAREIVSCHQSTENPFSPQLFYPLRKNIYLYVEQLDTKLMMYFSLRIERRGARAGELQPVTR